MMVIYNLVMTMMILDKISKISSVGGIYKKGQIFGYTLFFVLHYTPSTHPPTQVIWFKKAPFIRDIWLDYLDTLILYRLS